MTEEPLRSLASDVDALQISTSSTNLNNKPTTTSSSNHTNFVDGDSGTETHSSEKPLKPLVIESSREGMEV